MKKAAVITLGLLLMAILSFCVPMYDPDGSDYRVGRGRSDLHMIGLAMRRLSTEEKLTAHVLDRIDDQNEFSARVAPLLEGAQGPLDPWGQPYLLEKVEQGDHIVLTIRSSHEIRRKWYERKRRALGIEVT